MIRFISRLLGRTGRNNPNGKQGTVKDDPLKEPRGGRRPSLKCRNGNLSDGPLRANQVPWIAIR
ncbi:MAG: hypothetical protein JSU77_10235 [Fidelibacterota bacterium]|nr:MAG: hypothetical protein JSU77_10235 [Candidatus Neomarinimicrobiota bacterium]